MKYIRKFKKNTHGRDFVVGDLHGEYTKLMSQLEELSFDKDKDRLFAVGDLVDRGLESKKCLDLIFEPWFFSVKGNHEEMMVDAILHGDRGMLSCWIMNGGNWFLDLYDKKVIGKDEEYNNLVDTIVSIHENNLLPLAIEIESKKYGNVGIVHATPPLNWGEDGFLNCQQSEVLWGRFLYQKNTSVEGIDHVFVGHTPILYKDSPANFTGNITYIDSGAVFVEGRKLFIVEL